MCGNHSPVLQLRKWLQQWGETHQAKAKAGASGQGRGKVRREAGSESEDNSEYEEEEDAEERHTSSHTLPNRHPYPHPRPRPRAQSSFIKHRSPLSSNTPPPNACSAPHDGPVLSRWRSGTWSSSMDPLEVARRQLCTHALRSSASKSSKSTPACELQHVFLCSSPPP